LLKGLEEGVVSVDASTSLANINKVIPVILLQSLGCHVAVGRVYKQ
jgi:hypothetical protein